MQALDLIITLSCLVFSVVVHEVAHGWVAYRLGDPTARRAGRLTLNPLPHVDLFGSVILPLILIVYGSSILFGYAKPVPFDPAYFRDPKRGMMLVGLAGPLSNVILAAVAALLLRVFPDIPLLLAAVLEVLCGVNLILATFNLLPIPPLDGSRVLIGFLPRRAAESVLGLEPYGFIFVLVLLWVGILDRVLIPIQRGLLDLLLR